MKPWKLLFLLSLLTLPAMAFSAPPILGDFNGDGLVDCIDVDLLTAEIVSGTNNPSFDINGDGIVNLADLDTWLNDAGNFNLGSPYLQGDADLDGEVDGSDLLIWQSNLDTANAGYCGGDFNADGVVDVVDQAILCSNAPPTFCDDIVAADEMEWGAVKATFR